MVPKSRVALAFANMQGEEPTCVIKDASLHTACEYLGLQSTETEEGVACESLGLHSGSEIGLGEFQTLLVGLGLIVEPSEASQGSTSDAVPLAATDGEESEKPTAQAAEVGVAHRSPIEVETTDRTKSLPAGVVFEPELPLEEISPSTRIAAKDLYDKVTATDAARIATRTHDLYTDFLSTLPTTLSGEQVRVPWLRDNYLGIVEAVVTGALNGKEYRPPVMPSHLPPTEQKHAAEVLSRISSASSTVIKSIETEVEKQFEVFWRSLPSGLSLDRSSVRSA